MAIEQKIKYVGKCPKCELNYIKENEELCSVCSKKRFSDEWYSNDNAASQEREQKLKEIEERQKREELQDKNEILDIMKSYGFEGFCHTANLNNFINIYKSGFLKSRYLLESEGYKFEDNAESSVIEKTSDFIKKKVRFYYRSITPTNISAYINHNQKHPVLMVFDESLIYEDCMFTDGCPVSILTKIGPKLKYVKSFNWKEIFERGPFDACNMATRNYRNAEFLIKDKVSISKAKTIYFKSKEDMDFAIKKLGNDDRFMVNENKFYKEYVW